MHRVSYLIAILLSATVGTAATPTVAAADQDLSWLLASPADSGELDWLSNARQIPRRCVSTANCSPYTNVSCSSGTGTCVAVDRNCSIGQRGYVNCNGVTTFCPACDACIEGSLRNVLTGECCDNGSKEKQQQQCINGAWIPTGVYTCGGICVF